MAENMKTYFVEFHLNYGDGHINTVVKTSETLSYEEIESNARRRLAMAVSVDCIGTCTRLEQQ